MSLAALAALGLASAPAMASDHGMKENAMKSMDAGKKHHDKAKNDAREERKDMEREGKRSKDKAEKEGRKERKEKESRAKERMEDESGY
ncbi:MAG: hypothetical protein COS82_03145 [Zetaproteobacteria bacterium CG06_land_8_20_14_3_00_59_53]|nr:MAG: hypothetical protein AUK36_06825 [Zetaproteobacteria bacterium CG2_30_59_37]PIO89196.1 MAG: hypothetical protein COX56_09050 [Zetaproteobacteria bacterium CG23_combo_of_CG06-09_8_20_14_all_59_86]PIQ64952.1 MAG: hypothetical protein COV97_06825 [Zetaproteobacteria bacterium CG11_big_fil_rev_8_21_14_0_20_59_439]PIU71041.1 MAG: hypothetical protein COS82_03145 [Zetaproteobacteria bacterium CG06_land_8_20_14_3_00_59_53]PIU97932.1 MAG: hypothetical protein COS62_01160 [Zetaproteobacteria bac